MSPVRQAIREAQKLLVGVNSMLTIDGVWGPKTDATYVAAPENIKLSVEHVVAKFGTNLANVRQRMVRATQSFVTIKEAVDAAKLAGITGSSLINLLATIQVESRFTPESESHLYRTANKAKATFSSLRTKTDDQLLALMKDPAAFFETVYGHNTSKGKELGNLYAGDGYKFRGRGLIQITGRYLYSQFAKSSGYDVIGTPDLMNRTDVAIAAALWYWKTFVVSKRADTDIRSATAIVNNGSRDISERIAAAIRFKDQLA